jgi:hypothetical protein
VSQSILPLSFPITFFVIMNLFIIYAKKYFYRVPQLLLKYLYFSVFII